MKIYITNSNHKNTSSELSVTKSICNSHIYTDKDVCMLDVNETVTVFIVGNILGLNNNNSSECEKLTKSKLITILSEYNALNLKNCLEGNYIIVRAYKNDDLIEIFADKLSQRDIYYVNNNDTYEIATDLSLFDQSPSKSGYDQLGLAHALTVYGFRPPKKHTLYNNIKRLGLREYFTVHNNIASIKSIKFTPIIIEEYTEKDLNVYGDLFLDAVKIRSLEGDNIVYLSSGWDSTAILASLVHLHGPKKVRGVIGKMQYSERAGVINPFEVSRAQSVADYYGVKLDIIDFDYTKAVPECLEYLKPVLKNHFISSGTVLSHGILAEYVSRKYGKDNNVFAGEISDGVHNFGFSQFASIFHPVLDFREYSDKMLNYIYGPTFLTSFHNGKYKDDLIYKIFMEQYKNNIFDDRTGGGDESKNMQILSSFFLRNHRFPLYSINNSKILTKHGKHSYLEEMQEVYLKEASTKLTSENYYSWFIDLYNSFHWQGGTVATLPITAEAYGFNIQLPFYDTRLHDYLSAMPECFGRGLDLNPTKYPLKWMLKNKIDYPNHLQVGPHSYLYDVDHSFNHGIEVWYHSALKEHFQSILKKKEYLDFMSDEIFDIQYLDSLVDNYLNDEDSKSSSIDADLASVTYLSMVGIY